MADFIFILPPPMQTHFSLASNSPLLILLEPPSASQPPPRAWIKSIFDIHGDNPKAHNLTSCHLMLFTPPRHSADM
ncbi:hypothetical protein TsFJ059_000498 [Trichoderma semiorbis]|uniref:Uncharacterized protein n=1 Tax=Trichoderma semiorbis TaxID=1491008 RepID=A0A9P8HVG5_9HYPO|nr:hypothetical protein TsFJ059_000498 [Trichoderma semiorbis]